MSRVIAVLFVAVLMLGNASASAEFITTLISCPVSGNETTVRVHREEYEALMEDRNDKLASTNEVLYGERLDFASLSERLDAVNDVMRSISSDVNINLELLYPSGPIVSHGVHIDGVFVVYFKQGIKIGPVLMDRIYGEYERAAGQHGMSKPPVSFRGEELMDLD